MVTDLPSGFGLEDTTSPAIKQHKTANTLILLKPEDVIVKSSWLLLWWILHLRNLPCVNLKVAAVWNINHSCLESKYFRLCFMVIKVSNFVRKPQKHRRLQLFSSCLYAINTKKILKIAAFLFRFLLIFAEWLNSYLALVQIPISHFLWAKLKKICGFWKSYGNKLAEIKTKKCRYQSLLIKILRTVTCIHHKDFSEIFR